jgi:hypothetical protein
MNEPEPIGKAPSKKTLPNGGRPHMNHIVTYLRIPSAVGTKTYASDLITTTALGRWLSVQSRSLCLARFAVNPLRLPLQRVPASI